MTFCLYVQYTKERIASHSATLYFFLSVTNKKKSKTKKNDLLFAKRDQKTVINGKKMHLSIAFFLASYIQKIYITAQSWLFLVTQNHTA